MKSHEAIQTAIDGKTVDHAKALHLCSSSVHKWQEPSTDFTDSGSLNPLDRIETIIQTALNLGTRPEDAHAPIQYLAERFGMVSVPIPVHLTCTRTLSKQLFNTIQEFSDLTRVASIALEDGNIKKREAVDIDREGWELIYRVVEFIEAAKRAVK